MNRRILTEGIGLTIIGAFAFVEGLRLTIKRDPLVLYDVLGPGPYVIFLSLILMAIGVTHLIINYKKKIVTEKTEKVSREMRYKLVKMILGLVIYIFLVDIIGYLPATVLFFLLEFWAVGIKSWKSIIISTIVVTGSYYIIFIKYCQMIFPRGIIFK